MENLTEKQIRFCELYIESGNATKAAISAGYAAQAAHVQGSRLLKNDKIQQYLKARRSEIEQELREQFIGDALTARKVMLNILKDPEASHRDKLVAARDLLDRAGFKPTDKTEISGKDGSSLQVVFVDPK